MDYKTKSDLIAGLADSFCVEDPTDISVATSHYIPEKISIDATLDKIKVEDLKKTKNVIEEYIRRFASRTDLESAQVISHLRLASLCVSEIIVQKNKQVN